MPELLTILPGVHIDADELGFEYSRSGGPGGQHVNKVSTKATVRFRPASSPTLRPLHKELMLEKLADRLTAEGELVISCSEHRSQSRNREAAVERLLAVLAGALHRPKTRRPTKPSRGSRERRLDEKHRSAQRKNDRRPPE